MVLEDLHHIPGGLRPGPLGHVFVQFVLVCQPAWIVVELVFSGPSGVAQGTTQRLPLLVCFHRNGAPLVVSLTRVSALRSGGH